MLVSISWAILCSRAADLLSKQIRPHWQSVDEHWIAATHYESYFGKVVVGYRFHEYAVCAVYGGVKRMEVTKSDSHFYSIVCYVIWVFFFDDEFYEH
jgi:hypothetical protein